MHSHSSLVCCRRSSAPAAYTAKKEKFQNLQKIPCSSLGEDYYSDSEPHITSQDLRDIEEERERDQEELDEELAEAEREAALHDEGEHIEDCLKEELYEQGKYQDFIYEQEEIIKEGTAFWELPNPWSTFVFSLRDQHRAPRIPASWRVPPHPSGSLGLPTDSSSGSSLWTTDRSTRPGHHRLLLRSLIREEAARNRQAAAAASGPRSRSPREQPVPMHIATWATRTCTRGSPPSPSHDRGTSQCPTAVIVVSSDDEAEIQRVPKTRSRLAHRGTRHVRRRQGEVELTPSLVQLRRTEHQWRGWQPQ